MKTFALDQLDHDFADAIIEQADFEIARLTKDATTVAVLLKLPEKMEVAAQEIVRLGESPSGYLTVVVELKSCTREPGGEGARRPVFGAGRGSLTVVSEEEERLDDFSQ